MTLQNGLSLIALLIASIIAIDMIPLLRNWIQRIGIGRFSNVTLWNQAMVNQGSKWLLNTPKIKVTDNTRLIAIDMMKGNYSKTAIQHWQEASLLLGLSEYLKYQDDKDVRKNIVSFLNKKFDRTGQWVEKPTSIDGAILAYAVMKIDFIDAGQFKAAHDYIWELIKEHVGEDGTVEYRKHMKSYRYVDTIGFICPFLVAYGLKYKKDKCIELAIKQIKQYEKYGMLEQHGIPCHVYKVDNKVPLGLYGWGRGLGWYAIGLIDAWDQLPQGSKFKPALEESVKKFSKSVIQFQQESGHWNWTVTRPEARADSSTTATLGWFLLRASRISDISKECLASVDKSFHYLMQVTRRNGAVDFSQGDTKDIGVYSSHFSLLPFTQGFCIRSINYYLNQNKPAGERFGVDLKEVLHEDNRVYSNV